MRVIPNEIFPSVRSRAERQVHAALKSLPDDKCVAFHSVNLPDHEYKRLGEIDFLLVTPEMLLSIEVKGGSLSRRDGRWVYGSGQRRGTSPEGPFNQARSAMHSLEGRLKDTLGNRDMAQVSSGFLVITPDIDLPPSSEWAPSTYLGSAEYDRGRGLARALKEARRYWPPKNRLDHRTIPSDIRRRLINAIRADFDRAPGLAARANMLEESFKQLTEDQYRFIDVFDANDRTLCTGGAGSGKTFLAAEAARRWSASGSVLLTCASPCLSTFLQDVLRDSGVTVMPFESLANVAPNTFDRLIVDEAQDLMTFDHLDTLDRVLRNGLEAGRWVVLADSNNQVLDPRRFDPDGFEHLKSLQPAKIHLRNNCRNTAEIVRQTQVYTNADIGVTTAGAGDPVIFRDVQNGEDEADQLDSYLDTLFDGQVRPEDVTVVSVSGEWEATSARRSRRFRRMVRLPQQLGQPRSRVTWATVDEIKGLENRFVCVIDLDADVPSERLSALYVAMTRARTNLWIACRPETSAALKNLALVNL